MQAYITSTQFAELLQVSRGAFHGMRRRNPDMPAPIKIGTRVFRWDANDVHDWLRAKKETETAKERDYADESSGP